MTREEIIRQDLEQIYIGNLSTVDADLKLPEKGKYGSSFTWETGESRFIEEDGTVHRPLHGMGNRKVILTVTAEYEGASDKREFTATVLQEAKELLITEVRTVSLEAKKGDAPHLPSVVIVKTADGRLTTVPVAWEEPDPSKTEGTVEVEGIITGSDQRALAKITYKDSLEKEKGPQQKIWYFPLSDVRLKEGTLYEKYQKLMVDWLLQVDDGQMLYNFRKAAGLDTRGAKPMTGWDEDSCKLKGHTTGHYLSGIALAWAATGDVRFREKIHEMAVGLKECQDAFQGQEGIHPGFLSAYDEAQFDLLEEYTKYPEIWAPYYTLDKIMSGLEDCYLLAGEEVALQILDPLGDWVYARLSRLPREQREKMWSMYIAGEFGGMPGAMVKLYKITGKKEHLDAALMFYNEKLYYPMEEDCDTLEDMHANQHIPQILGAMDLYEVEKEKKFWDIGEHFWDIVTGGHIYCIGGTGETEMFHRAGMNLQYLTEKAAESCASYNMLRLTGQIFQYRPQEQLMEYYENTLCNHILASSSHEADGGTTYFMPLCPGGVKEYSTTENTCCHGTGMESRFRYMENIYAYDEKNVYVNLLIDSVLSGREELELTTEMEKGLVTVRCHKDMEQRLKIRVPEWANEKVRVFRNGEAAELVCEDGYAVFDSVKAGEEIRMELPIELRIVENAEDKSLVNLACGPYFLAAVSDSKDFLTLPRLDQFKAEEKPFHFTAEGVEFLPFPEVDLEPQHLYFKR
ncbi:beta-L-arabinofuranosidase domain-containing protein [uncultured Merdimonas sp.]|uniref:beta-L-arabinofuranosidase domain-containing protein n=1 Tax=uncultured Merdimonas sp. TaxID=2023269 RepID=UPI0032097B16